MCEHRQHYQKRGLSADGAVHCIRAVWLFAALIAGISALASAQSAYLVKDIKKVPGGSEKPDASNFLKMGDSVYFLAQGADFRKNLWKTDGTAIGTKNINNYGSFYEFLQVGDSLYFCAGQDANANLRAIWSSDGTASGTQIIKSLQVPYGNASWLKEFDGDLFYFSTTGLDEVELCKLDLATKMIFPLRSLPATAPSQVQYTEAGGTLYFTLNNQIWHTTGTSESLSMVDFAAENPRDFFFLENMLYFCSGDYLYKTVPGSSTAEKVASDITIPHAQKNMAVVSGTMFFCAEDQAHGYELWKTDGSSSGTQLVKDIPSGSEGSKPCFLTPVNDDLYFFANATSVSQELWVSDGTESGTNFVSTVSLPTYMDGTLDGLPSIVGMDSCLYFPSKASAAGLELWRSDGTPVGTALVADINPGPGGSRITNLTNVGGTLYFQAYSEQTGYSVWRSDGTAQGTLLVANTNTVAPSSFPERLFAMKDRMFFRAIDDSNRSSLWSSDGTDQGTTEVMSGYFSIFPQGISSDSVFFYGEADGKIGLCVTDGTPGNTVLLNEDMRGLTVDVQKDLFFSTSNSLQSGFVPAIWKTDGTPSGTTKIKEFGGATNVICMSRIGQKVLALVEKGSETCELWTTDGTPAGTEFITTKSIHCSLSIAVPNRQSLRNVAFFLSSKGRDTQLWRTDGTSSGTFVVLDFAPGSEERFLNNFAITSDFLFFLSGTKGLCQEIWRSDGTLEGTVMLNTLVPEFDPEKLDYFTNMAVASSNKVGFTAARHFFTQEGEFQIHHSVHELWTSDGTATGTQRLLSSEERFFYEIDSIASVPNTGSFVFGSDTGRGGFDLWFSDGTTQGTHIIISSSRYENYGYYLFVGESAVAGDKLFFAVNSEKYGVELWALPLSALNQSAAKNWRLYE